MHRVFAQWAGGFMTRKKIAWVALLLILSLVFIWHLADLTPGLGPAEQNSQTHSTSISYIFNHPANLPINIVQYALVSIAPNSFISLRLPAVLFAILFTFCFWGLACGWFGRTIGFFGTIIFMTLPFFIICSRQASGEMMFFIPILFMYLYWVASKSTNRSSWIWASIIVLAALSIYIPGMIWWLIGAYFISRRQLNEPAAGISLKFGLIAFTIAGFIITPLVIASVKQVDNLKMLLGLPQTLNGPIDVLKDIAWMFLALFIKTGHDNVLILARAPILNIITLALIFFGIYAMCKASLAKTVGLGISILLSVFLAGLNQNVAFLGLGLPAALLFATAGLRYLYFEWRTVFPRNPLAKSFALVLIALVTFTQAYYGLRYALVAWPNSQTVKHLYVLK